MKQKKHQEYQNKKLISSRFCINVLIVAISLVVVLLLCTYSYLNFDKHDPSVNKFIKDMDKYDGALAVNSGDIIDRYDKQYLKVDGAEILLEFNEKIPKAVFGKTAVEGYYRKPGYIEVVSYRIYKYNYIKYILSFAGGLYLLLLILKEWKITAHGLKPKGESHA